MTAISVGRQREFVASFELCPSQVSNFCCEICNPANLLGSIGKQRVESRLHDFAFFSHNLENFFQHGLISRVMLSKAGQLPFQCQFNIVTPYLWRKIRALIVPCLCHVKVAVQIIFTRLYNQNSQIWRRCVNPVIIGGRNDFHFRHINLGCLLFTANNANITLSDFMIRPKPAALFGFFQQNKHASSRKAKNNKPDYSGYRDAIRCSAHSCKQKKKKDPNSNQHLQSAFINVSPHVQNLTQSRSQVYTCAIPAITGGEFRSSEAKADASPLLEAWLFLCLIAPFTLWWIVRGGASLLGSFSSSLLIPHGLPPVFRSSDGRYILLKELHHE